MAKKFGLAAIGAGARSRCILKHLLEIAPEQLELVAVYDPDPEVIASAKKYHWPEQNPKLCASSEEAIHTPGVDWVMVFSPNAFHKEHILQGFAAGKPVFSEKPLATSIADCQEIYAAQQKCGLFFATGFVLRYAPMYRKAKELLDSGRFGKLVAIEANENIPPAHGGYIMTNWRRLSKLAGPHILEKCCHDLDLLNWFTNSLPTKIAAFGGRDIFVPANNFMLKKYGEATFKSWWNPRGIDTPFTDDSDMMDNTLAVAVFRNGIRATFTATMCNAIPERRMNFICSEGSIKLDFYERKLRYKTIGGEGIMEVAFPSEGHGGGDHVIATELVETITRQVPPKCSGAEGLRSAVFALAIDQAARTNQMVDLEPVWAKLDL